jgi:hypothetical protein
MSELQYRINLRKIIVWCEAASVGGLFPFLDRLCALVAIGPYLPRRSLTATATFGGKVDTTALSRRGS